MQLKQARILLTGASGGLGQALARQLTQAGASVLLAGRDAAKLEALQTELGSSASHVIADLNSAAGITHTVQAAVAFKANVLINNAGISAFGLFDEQHWSVIEQLVTTNLLTPMRLTHALLAHLKGQPEAAIINVGSTFGSIPFAGFAAYSSAKAGLRGFSQSLRRELSDSNVAVIHVAPRAIDTALNTPAVNALNLALKNHSDSPNAVARRIITALQHGRGDHHIGFPERLFAWLNGFAPSLVDSGLAAKLPIIKQHARTSLPTSSQ
ncbi:SDR family oxidoreductase [Rhodoferax sp.]|uniref:SDR family oxidoreductase n=1 Tax=Rhodoferax sp. TaxID=50421 RepID=UPI00261FF801|nr:SDR family oxidoreductase [Rhodoferax sp.]MDD2923871.1 SDR family oxidoreductase [Rhodoferax sp.]